MSGLTFIEALQFRQEGRPELKCNRAPLKSSTAKHGGVMEKKD